VVLLPPKPGAEDGMSEGLYRGPAAIDRGAHLRRRLLSGDCSPRNPRPLLGTERAAP